MRSTNCAGQQLAADLSEATIEFEELNRALPIAGDSAANHDFEFLSLIQKDRLIVFQRDFNQIIQDRSKYIRQVLHASLSADESVIAVYHVQIDHQADQKIHARPLRCFDKIMEFYEETQLNQLHKLADSNVEYYSNEQGQFVQRVNLPAPPPPPQASEPEKRTGGSKLDFFRIKKKQYKWAIKPDVVILILFVLWCTFTYKALIHGNYWGVAVHPISEFQNDSLSYWSSSSSENDHSEFYPEEEDYGDELSLAADEPAFAEGQLNQALTNDYRE